MPYYEFFWNDEAIEHLAEHGISPEDFERVVRQPEHYGCVRGIGRGDDLAGDRLRGPRTTLGAQMDKPQAKRIMRDVTPSERERLKRYREQIAQELPDLQARDQMRKDAREESTLSGELRRAVHASELSLAEIAARIGITPILLDDFLTGERTLRSDMIDRLASVLGLELHRVAQ